MSVIMTAAGEALKARLQAEGKPLVIDTFVFAHIPNLDPTEQLTPGITVPTDQVVYTYPIPDEYRAYVNPNQVVYSALLGSDVGDWSFNWQGLVCSGYDTLIAAATFPALEKRKYSGATGAAGNNLTRNFLLEFSGAKELTGITISADVWQLDFTIRLLGMDERERLSNFDLYGEGWFYGDGWKLARQGGQYACAPGFGYVGGIRAELAEPMPVVATFTPADVWLDVCLKPQGSDRVATAAPMVVEPDTEVPFSAADETGLMHYRALIAHVDAGGGITDKRQPMNGTDGASGQLADVQRLMKRKVNAGKGLIGGGPLSSDVTLSAKLDGKTVQADAGDAITVKDVAIGGDASDLASARGQIGDNIRINTASDLNAYTKAGNWLFSDAAAGENFPNIGRGGELNCYVSTTAIFQFFTEFNNNRRYIRYGIPNSTWTNWIQFISVAQLGDGIRNTNGIISVPEYEGATVSAAGTSGLVPPAAAGQQESFLTGGGEYKPALSTGGGVMTGSIQINDPANVIGLAPSTNTERGLFLGDKNSVIMGGFDIIQRASDNAKYTQFYSKNSSGHITSLAAVTYEDGTRELVADSPLQINDIQIKQVVDGGRRVIVLSGARGNQGHSFRFSPDTGEAYMDGRVIHAKADTAGYADAAGSANALGGKAESALSVAYARDSGAMNGKAESALSVNYANSAGQVYLAGSAVQWVVNTSGPAITVPQGGTYNVVCICFNDSGGKGAVKHYPNIAGGTVIPNAPTDYMVAGLCARVA